MEKFKLDLVNDLVKEAIEALCKRKRWQDTFRHIIKAKRFNPNRADGIISSKSSKTKPLLSIIFER
ncbi:MAG TPA: hypothetical protein VGK47_12430 [Nitrososphaeraceae archaeon]